ncbi:MAG TPA: SurA N-terminal domain-containing protein [Thermoanaerobaculia bacterium]|jgi:parvulin-like peptidyl-prolyl isomerase
MKPNSRLLSLLLALAAFAATAAAQEMVERIVARVNDGLVTQTEYDKRLALATRSANVPAPTDEIRLATLEDMIKEHLLEDRAKEMSVSATDEEIQAAVDRVKEQYNLKSDADFEAALQGSGMTKDDLRRQMKQTITLQKVIGREVTSRLDLSDDALRSEYERRKEQFYAIPESAHVAELVLRYPANDAEARKEAVAKIEDLQAQVKGGKAFADLVKDNSEGNTKSRGGDLGTVTKGELVEALDAGIFVEPAVEYPPPVLMPDSIHWFHVTERKPAGFKPFADVKEDLKRRISDDLYEKRFGEYMDRLRREAYVKIYDANLAKLDEKKPAA